MEDVIAGIIGVLLNFAVPLALLFATWLTYHSVASSRRKYLENRENYFRGRIIQTNLKTLPGWKCSYPVMVSGSAVIANNYFISFIAGFKHLFGGELKGYTAMCSDARRLAVIRMLEETEALGANMVLNIRFETATVTSASNQKQSGGVELIAYGTAVRVDS